MKKLFFKRKKTIDEIIIDGVEAEVLEAKREWKHLKKFKNENHLLFTAFIVLLSAGIIINSVYMYQLTKNSAKQNNQAATLTVPDSAKYLTSHQAGANSALQVKVSNVTETDKVDRAFTILPDETMLIASIEITNTTTDTQQLIPVSQLYVRSSEGDYSALHASSFVTTPLAATELAPGKTASGQISFNVPKQVAHPLLYVDTGWGNTVPIVFDILY
ncbi:MAG: DUF4352 domain-containing protein [Candidatus Saccharimonadaceae bacterium]